MTPNSQEVLYYVALTLTKGIGAVIGRQILSFYGSPENFFKESSKALSKLTWITPSILKNRTDPQLFSKAEKELSFAQKYQIDLLFCDRKEYPFRLNECNDAPLMLYYKGCADLNTFRVLSIVGTRRPTSYGLRMCEEMMETLRQKCPDVLVCSGLAYGIDVATHKEALRNQLKTVGVLGHSLDIIYPDIHRNVAVEMVEQGGLLSEYPSETGPDRPNFVMRNRIIAGMADATVVVESSERGGSLITAAAADSYNREIFAFPGRSIDSSSCGCNNLIRDCKASLATSMDDILKAMNWESTCKQPVQQDLFLTLSDEENNIVKVLYSQSEGLHINQIALQTGLPVYKLSSILLEMEMKGLVKTLPGCLYRIG